MKKLIFAALAMVSWIAADAQAPIGVCVSNVTLTISNGYTAPVPFALATLCSAGSTQSTCAANIKPIFTSTALSNPTPTNPFKADVGGNYFFCAAVGHYALMLAGSQGTYFVPDIALVDDWSKGGTVTGTWTATSFVGPLTGNASTASASDHAPTQCGAGNFSTGVTSTWAANCSAPYYQTDQSNGTPVTQAAANNFAPRFTLTPVTGATTIDLAAVGTAGNYAFPSSITTDAYGRVTAITATSATSRTCNANGCYTVATDGTVHEWGTLIVGGTAQQLTATITFPFTFPTQVTSVVESQAGQCLTSNQLLPVAVGAVSTSRSSVSLVMAQPEVSGGGSANFNGACPIAWTADGN